MINGIFFSTDFIEAKKKRLFFTYGTSNFYSTQCYKDILSEWTSVSFRGIITPNKF